ILFSRFLLEAAKFFCCLTRCFYSPDFDFDERGIPPKLPGFRDSSGCSLLFASGQKRKMIVLDDNGIAEAEPMSSAITEVQRALIKQPPRGLSRADDTRRRAAPPGAFLQATDRGGDPAHALHEI